MPRKKQAGPRNVRRESIDPRRPPEGGPDALYDPANPGHRWDRPLQAPGRMQVDFEERVDFRRLHDYRLARTRNALAKSGLGALLVFDQYNIRYISSTVIGEWARDKLTRWCLLTGNGEPWVWDFGSAARHHKLYAPWLPQNHWLAGLAGLRGAVSPRVGLFEADGEGDQRHPCAGRRGRRCRSASTSSSRRFSSRCRSSASRCATASR